MRWTSEQYQAWILRQQNSEEDRLTDNSGASHEVEELHKPILAWCREQWPAVPYIYSRSDKAATIGKGIHDLTLFYKGQVICIECKTATGKQTLDQLAWAKMMEQQGHKVWVVRSMAEFMAIVNGILHEKACASRPTSAGLTPTKT